jgi:hypothetical protein
MSKVLLLILCLDSANALGAARDAIEIVRESRSVATSSSFSSLLTINQNEGKKIYRSMMYVKNNVVASKVAIFCREPVDLKGSAFLTQVSAEGVARKWFYLPVVGSPREASASEGAMKILGTDIRFFDLAPPPLSSFRYSFSSVPDEKSSVWRIKAEPVSDQVSKDYGIASVFFEIAKDTLLTMRSIVNLVDGRRRTMEVQKVSLSGRWSIPTIIEYRLKDGEKVASQTRIELGDLDVKTPIDEDLFDPKRLNRAP